MQKQKSTQTANNDVRYPTEQSKSTTLTVMSSGIARGRLSEVSFHTVTYDAAGAKEQVAFHKDVTYV